MIPKVARATIRHLAQIHPTPNSTTPHPPPQCIQAANRAVATYLGADGGLSRFKVEAFDEAGLIGDGEHTRAVVTTGRLVDGAEKRRR